ncbi:MAG: ATP-binding protein [Halanaerobiales bacterium]|nr:ATP-binding protein [Halanaerobiales bacterium]
MNYPHLKETQVIDLIRDLVNQFQYNYLKCRIVLESNDIPIMKVDPILLQRAIYNIMLNAIEAMNEKGIIRIRVEVIKQKLLIRIIDNGHGIKPGYEEKIFQLGYTTRGESRGKGLDLAIVSRIIRELHRGSIKIENNPNQEGVIVTLEIPIDLQEEEVESNRANDKDSCN